MRQKMLSEALRERFGTKVYKLSLSSGCTCPNRDGTIGTGGCTFCSEEGSGEFAAPFLPVDEQIRLARARVDGKFPAKIPVSERKYIAYFQSFTNTYGEPERLRALYEETIRRPEIAALSIGTRPDCLPADILQMLEELNRIKPVWVELGLQTIHERTAEAVHRGYSLPAFEDAVKKLKETGSDIITGFSDDRAEIISPDDIYRIYSENQKVLAVTEKGTFRLRMRLYQVEEKLTGRRFVRISNSEIINLNKTANFDLSFAGTIQVKLKNGDVTFVSRRYVSEIKKILGI